MTFIPVPYGTYERERPGGTTIGGTIKRLATSETSHEGITRLLHQGVRHVLLGIPEDVGIRANFGRPGGAYAWNAFLSTFLNKQHNRFFNGNALGLLGAIDVGAQQAAAGHPEELRSSVAALDAMVLDCLLPLHAASLLPIVIGGGHNNALPLIRSLRRPVAVLNLDAHADFRPLDGRHSGNAFSYAAHEGRLARYAVIGLDAHSVGSEVLEMLDSLPWHVTSRQELRRMSHPEQSHRYQGVRSWIGVEYPVGLEIDVDVIAHAPSSASSPVGIDCDQVVRILREAVPWSKVAYIHLTEASPPLAADGTRIVGNLLSELVTEIVSLLPT